MKTTWGINNQFSGNLPRLDYHSVLKIDTITHCYHFYSMNKFYNQATPLNVNAMQHHFKEGAKNSKYKRQPQKSSNENNRMG